MRIKPILYQDIRKWVTILASGIAIGTTGFGSYWGNMFVYFVSYIQTHFQVESDLTDPWIFPFWLIGVASVNFFSGQLARKIGKRATLFCGIFLQNFGIVMVYFVIKNSIALVNIFLGFVHGIGGGCVQITLSQYVLEWGGNRPGLYIAIVRSFTMAGAIGINHFVTVYVNPDNLTPDTQIGSQRVFSQSSVVERVPIVFVICGGFFFCLEIICLLLLRENPGYSRAREAVKSDHNDLVSENTQLVESDGTKIKTDIKGLVDNEHYEQYTDDNIEMDMSPKQVIRRKEFYVLAFTMSCACVSFVNTNNYYKSYAQTLIQDDLFLTTVADVVLGLKFFLAISWGAFFDKYGVKPGLVAYLACVSLSNIVFYFAPLISKWVYPIGALCLVGISTPMNTLYSISVAKLFGKTHCTSNFGLVTLFCAMVYLVTPVVLQALLQDFGWFYVFFLAAFLPALALMVSVLALDG